MEEDVEIRKPEEIDYQKVLLIQLNRIARIQSFILMEVPTTKAFLTFEKTVEALETLLHPFFDEKYLKERQEILEKRKKYNPRFEGMEDGFYFYVKKQAEALMDLIARKGLLVEKATEVEIK